MCAVGHTEPDDSCTPTHGHTHAYKTPGAPQNVMGVSASRLWANWEAQRSTGSGSTLLLNESHSCWYSYWWRKKQKISRTQNIIVTFLLQMAGNKEPFWNISVSFSCCCCFLEWRHYDPLLCLIHCYSVCGSGTYKTRIPKSWDAV